MGHGLTMAMLVITRLGQFQKCQNHTTWLEQMVEPCGTIAASVRKEHYRYYLGKL